MKKVYVVILNFNGANETIDCLASLAKCKSGKDIKIETVVIDNGSKDDSVEKISKKFPEVTLIENKVNLGFTGGSNEGMRYAIKSGADYVMLLNNDTVVEPTFIEKLVETFTDEKIGGVLPKIYFAKGFEYHKDRYAKNDLGKVIWYAGGHMDWKNLIGKNIGVDEVDQGQFDEEREIDLATGCCFMIRADVLQKVGLFDDKLFLYYEDADLTQRIKRAGFKIMYQPKAVIWHKNAQSSGGSGSSLQDYYISRNRLLLGEKWAPFRTRAALIREALKMMATGRRWQKVGVRDYFLRKFGKGSYPI